MRVEGGTREADRLQRPAAFELRKSSGHDAGGLRLVRAVGDHRTGPRRPGLGMRATRQREAAKERQEEGHKRAANLYRASAWRVRSTGAPASTHCAMVIRSPFDGKAVAVCGGMVRKV